MQYREIIVGEGVGGMRLDRFLSLRFPDRSRSSFARAIKEGLVQRSTGAALDCAHRVMPGETLHLYVPGIAPAQPPPPFPPILHEDDHIVVINKPAGLLSHPSGTAFVWAVISLAKQRYRGERVDLLHRLDRDTSGVLALTRDLATNRALKSAVARGDAYKEYEGIVKGVIPWEERSLRGPIGPAMGPIRVQMAVRSDGLSARTDVTVLRRSATHTWVRCVLHTGRTHQIRVHLAHEGFPLLGDRLYGVPSALFLADLEGAPRDQLIAGAGAPRHALHARRIVLPAEGGRPALAVAAPVPEDMERWWTSPEVLPYDR